MFHNNSGVGRLRDVNLFILTRLSVEKKILHLIVKINRDVFGKRCPKHNFPSHLLGDETALVIFFLKIEESIWILICQNSAANVSDSIVNQARSVDELVLIHVSDFRSVAYERLVD